MLALPPNITQVYTYYTPLTFKQVPSVKYHFPPVPSHPPLFPSQIGSSQHFPSFSYLAMASHPVNHWEAPRFNFNSPYQLEGWKVFYTRVLDYLEALDINTDEADHQHPGWHQLKIMFEGEDRQTFQSLIDNGTITAEHQKMPHNAIDAISITIKAKEHFWHFQDKLLSDVCQLPNEGNHALLTCICTLVIQCRFSQPQTWEILKIMVLQHAVPYHEARNWIQLQDQSQLTYQYLLAQCKLLESSCEQYQKAKERGGADLMTITAATTSASSIHGDALNA